MGRHRRNLRVASHPLRLKPCPRSPNHTLLTNEVPSLAGQSGVQFSAETSEPRVFCKAPGPAVGPSTLLFSGYRGSFCTGKAGGS